MHARQLLLLTALLASSTTAAARVPNEQVDSWNDRYDVHFRKYAKRYFGPHIDWCWFKSQGIAESGLEPDATSEAGARGLMQIMPATYREIRRENPHFLDADQPRWNIAAGIFYDRKLYDKWRTPPAGEQRLLFTFGSYNAGYGRIYKAFRQDPDRSGSWHTVTRFVPPQTRHYVRRIQKLMDTPAGSGMSIEQ
jgi:membrane-bound lytic murein transglycosylase F